MKLLLSLSRSRQTKERSSHRHSEVGDDEKGDEGGRHHSKGDRRRPPEQGTDRAGSRHRHRGTPTRQSNGNNQPTQPSTNGRGLVSLTTDNTGKKMRQREKAE
ncbi:hypothetical protein ACTXT7_000849 [Hymenolepis weldensis]